MNSETSTSSSGSRTAGFGPGHFYLLLSMCGATAAVLMSRDSHPAALLLLSAAVMASGGAAYALHQALVAFWSGPGFRPPIKDQTRDFLEREKALVLRSIKELEFDHAMRKVGEADFAEMSSRLRARALDLMQDLEHQPPAGAVVEVRAGVVEAAPEITSEIPPLAPGVCAQCATVNDEDARFCKQCGARVGGR
jgi:hypothetical protein